MDVSPLCRACRQPIAPKAGKCHHCGSFQGLRRWGTLAATSGSLGLAVITLAGLVGPQVQFYLSPQTAVNVSTIASTGDHYVVLIENRGRRAVVLNRAIAFWPDHPELSGDGMAWLDVEAVGSADITLIEGRSSQTVALYFPAYLDEEPRPDIAGGMFIYANYPPQGFHDCMIEFDFVNSEGSFYKYASEVDETVDGTAYQCSPQYWNFLQGVKAVG